jgi:hypothetical protein
MIARTSSPVNRRNSNARSNAATSVSRPCATSERDDVGQMRRQPYPAAAAARRNASAVGPNARNAFSTAVRGRTAPVAQFVGRIVVGGQARVSVVGHIQAELGLQSDERVVLTADAGEADTLVARRVPPFIGLLVGIGVNHRPQPRLELAMQRCLCVDRA